jgi:hypothetical protein
MRSSELSFMAQNRMGQFRKMVANMIRSSRWWFRRASGRIDDLPGAEGNVTRLFAPSLFVKSRRVTATTSAIVATGEEK